MNSTGTRFKIIQKTKKNPDGTMNAYYNIAIETKRNNG